STGDECEACGGTLRVCGAQDYPAIAAALEEGRNAHRPHWDGALPLVALVAAPWLLGLLAGGLRDLSIAVGVIFLAMGGAVAAAAGRAPAAPSPPAAWRPSTVPMPRRSPRASSPSAAGCSPVPPSPSGPRRPSATPSPSTRRRRRSSCGSCCRPPS